MSLIELQKALRQLRLGGIAEVSIRHSPKPWLPST